MLKDLTDVEINSMCYVYAHTNQTMKDFAKMYNCSPSAISRKMQKAIIMRNSK